MFDSIFCSVLNRFLNSSWTSICVILFVLHMVEVGCWSLLFTFNLYVKFDVAQSCGHFEC